MGLATFGWIFFFILIDYQNITFYLQNIFTLHLLCIFFALYLHHQTTHEKTNMSEITIYRPLTKSEINKLKIIKDENLITDACLNVGITTQTWRNIYDRGARTKTENIKSLIDYAKKVRRKISNCEDFS